MPQNARRSPETDTSRTTTSISNSKEEKTSITMSTGKLDGGTTENQGETAGSVFISNFAVANFTMAHELELVATYII